MASTKFIVSMTNCLNDMKRDIINEVGQKIQENELMTDAIQGILDEILASVKQNKRIKKEHKPRYSGYHLFMKEERVKVKAEQPDIRPQDLTSVVSKAWKVLSDEEKTIFNERAAKMKAEMTTISDSEGSDSEKAETSKAETSNVETSKAETSNVETSNAEKPKAEKPKAKKSDEKKKESKRGKKKEQPAPPPEVVDNDDDIPSVVEEADSDIDL